MKVECGLQDLVTTLSKEEKRMKSLSFEEECDFTAHKLRKEF